MSNARTVAEEYSSFQLWIESYNVYVQVKKVKVAHTRLPSVGFQS